MTTPEYHSWQGMIQRCTNPKNRKWPIYGGRGIRVCAKWRNDFTKFFVDVGPRPSPKHTIDRYPNQNGNYEPGNVRWATPSEQARNMRTNRLIESDGRTQCLSAWAEELKITPSALHQRMSRHGLEPKVMNEISEEKMLAIGEALSSGKSTREIAKLVGVAKMTVQRYRKLYLECVGPIDPCGCGRPNGHRGWCRARLDQRVLVLKS